ncbi:MAG: hypothetical protein RMJ98_02750 [Myxococcales bacterium]|nr:hypothetical protein [Polyangiaceae bacterium]MDW8248209.1 hypothetical protein [Myxococcales bacterium]
MSDSLVAMDLLVALTVLPASIVLDVWILRNYLDIPYKFRKLVAGVFLEVVPGSVLHNEDSFVLLKDRLPVDVVLVFVPAVFVFVFVLVVVLVGEIFSLVLLVLGKIVVVFGGIAYIVIDGGATARRS